MVNVAPMKPALVPMPEGGRYIVPPATEFQAISADQHTGELRLRFLLEGRRTLDIPVTRQILGDLGATCRGEPRS